MNTYKHMLSGDAFVWYTTSFDFNAWCVAIVIVIVINIRNTLSQAICYFIEEMTKSRSQFSICVYALNPIAPLDCEGGRNLSLDTWYSVRLMVSSHSWRCILNRACDGNPYWLSQTPKESRICGINTIRFHMVDDMRVTTHQPPQWNRQMDASISISHS